MSFIYNKIGNKWDEILQGEFKKDYFMNLDAFLENEYNTKTIYPKKENVFNALKLAAPENIKVVILGQDPYINENQAYGLALSVMPGVKLPPSLRNMYKELEEDLDIPISKNGCLIKWAKQGVLLLNTVLTVEARKSNSHAKKGWEIFTDKIIEYLGIRGEPIVFLLWGNPAKEKEKYIINKKHLVLKSTHPSPLSAYNGFFGSRPYSKTNKFLRENGIEEIDWKIN